MSAVVTPGAVEAHAGAHVGVGEHSAVIAAEIGSAGAALALTVPSWTGVTGICSQLRRQQVVGNVGGHARVTPEESLMETL